MKTTHHTCLLALISLAIGSLSAIQSKADFVHLWHYGPEVWEMPTTEWIPETDPAPTIADPQMPCDWAERLGHQYYLILDTGAWYPVTASADLPVWEDPLHIFDSFTDESGVTWNRWSGAKELMWTFALDGEIPAPPGGWQPETRFWICDTDTGDWTGAYYPVCGLVQPLAFGPAPELLAQVCPTDLYVLKKAKITGDVSFKGSARIWPRGDLSMGSFQSGPRP